MPLASFRTSWTPSSTSNNSPVEWASRRSDRTRRLFSQRPIRLRDATAAITEYKRSTADPSGVVDLLLTFVESGTEQAADLGVGDDAYFMALERKASEAVAALDALSDAPRAAAVDRLIQLGEYQNQIGWSCGDFLGNVAARVKERYVERVKR